MAVKTYQFSKTVAGEDPVTNELPASQFALGTALPVVVNVATPTVVDIDYEETLLADLQAYMTTYGWTYLGEVP